MANFSFSNFGAYTLLILALALFFALRLVTWIFPLLVPNAERRKIALRYKSLVELLIWIVFMIWSVQFLYSSNQPYAYALFLLLFLITAYMSWIGLKDMIAGAFLKAGHKLSVNEVIRVDDYSGKIIRFGHTSLLLETDSGETLFLPYSFLFGKVIIKSQPTESIHRHTFQFDAVLTGTSRETTESIRGFILTLPWTSLKKEPQIKPVAESVNGGQVIEITLFAIEKEHFQDMEKLIKERFSLARVKK